MEENPQNKPNQSAEQSAANNDTNLITPNMETPKGKKGVIFGVVGVLIAVAAAGSYFLFSKDVPETPPALSIKDSASNLTGMMSQDVNLEIEGSEYLKSMLGFDDDDKEAFDTALEEEEWQEVGEINREDDDELFATGWYINNSGGEVSFQDIYERIDPDGGAVIIITFDPEEHWIASYQDVFIPAEGSEYEMTVLSIEDMEAEEEGTMIANGQAFQIVSVLETMLYDPGLFANANLDGQDSYEALDFCHGDSAGWLVGSLGTRDAAATLCACQTAVKAVHTWDASAEEWNQIFSVNDGEDIHDLQAAEYDNAISWVMLSEPPAEADDLCADIEIEDDPVEDDPVEEDDGWTAYLDPVDEDYDGIYTNDTVEFTALQEVQVSIEIEVPEVEDLGTVTITTEDGVVEFGEDGVRITEDNEGDYGEHDRTTTLVVAEVNEVITITTNSIPAYGVIKVVDPEDDSAEWGLHLMPDPDDEDLNLTCESRDADVSEPDEVVEAYLEALSNLDPDYLYRNINDETQEHLATLYAFVKESIAELDIADLSEATLALVDGLDSVYEDYVAWYEEAFTSLDPDGEVSEALTIIDTFVRPYLEEIQTVVAELTTNPDGTLGEFLASDGSALLDALYEFATMEEVLEEEDDVALAIALPKHFGNNTTIDSYVENADDNVAAVSLSMDWDTIHSEMQAILGEDYNNEDVEEEFERLFSTVHVAKYGECWEMNLVPIINGYLEEIIAEDLELPDSMLIDEALSELGGGEEVDADEVKAMIISVLEAISDNIDEYNALKDAGEGAESLCELSVNAVLDSASTVGELWGEDVTAIVDMINLTSFDLAVGESGELTLIGDIGTYTPGDHNVEMNETLLGLLDEDGEWTTGGEDADGNWITDASGNVMYSPAEGDTGERLLMGTVVDSDGTEVEFNFYCLDIEAAE